MKYIHVYALFLMVVFLSSCKQKQTNAPPDIIRSETKDSVSSYGPTMDFPVTVFVYSLKTKPASFGLVHKEKVCSFMMVKHLQF
jgi:hypothetical protein